MNYKEMMAFQKAYISFLTRLTCKQEIEICYYFIKNKIYDSEFSYIGYETCNLGLHGIHYSKTKNLFYFGTLNKNNFPSTLHLIPLGDLEKMSVVLRDGLLMSIRNKKAIKIQKCRSIELS